MIDIIEKMLEELMKGNCSPYLERLGIVRLVQWDVVTGPSGVPLPVRMGYTINYNTLLFFGACIVFLYISHQLRNKDTKAMIVNTKRGKILGVVALALILLLMNFYIMPVGHPKAGAGL